MVAVIDYVGAIPFIKSFIVAVIDYVGTIPFIKSLIIAVVDHQAICKHIGTDTNEEQCQKEIFNLLHPLKTKKRDTSTESHRLVLVSTFIEVNHIQHSKM